MRNRLPSEISGEWLPRQLLSQTLMPPHQSEKTSVVA